jgi:hypothetical protein
MRATFMNSASLVSIGTFFSLIITTLATSLPPVLSSGLIKAGVSASDANRIAHLPPTAALFAAFLGYNPMSKLLGPNVLNSLSAADRANLLGHSFFPNLISPPFMLGLHAVFYLSAVMCFIAACASLLRGKRYVYEEEVAAPEPAHV